MIQKSLVPNAAGTHYLVRTFSFTFQHKYCFMFYKVLTSASNALTYRDAFMVDKVTWLSSNCWKTSSVALEMI